MLKQFLLIALLALLVTGISASEDDPERYAINQIIKAQKAPAGVIFAVREYEEDALIWVLPRVERYIQEIRSSYPEISIAMMSHGDELTSLSHSKLADYHSMHQLLKKLVVEQQLRFHICGTMAEMSGLSADDFPEYVDVVPFGPSQVEDYLSLGYVLVDLELTW